MVHAENIDLVDWPIFITPFFKSEITVGAWYVIDTSNEGYPLATISISQLQFFSKLAWWAWETSGSFWKSST